MAVRDYFNNPIAMAELDEKVKNVYSRLKDLPDTVKMTVDEWKKEFWDNKTIRCKKFNRRDNWGWFLIVRWFESLFGFYTSNPLLYCDIKSCLDFCKQKGLSEDVAYFKNYYDKGYKYIIIEGGNRHDSTYLFWKNKKDNRDIAKLNTMILKSVDRQTMHEAYIRVAYGNSPNRQEVRTGFYGWLSDKVRELSENFFKAGVFNRIKALKFQRMEEDELLAKSYGYTKYQTLDKLDDRIDSDYRDKNPSDTKAWLENLSMMKRFYLEYNKFGKTKEFRNGFWYTILIVVDWMRRETIKVNDWAKFTMKFHEFFSNSMAKDKILYDKGKSQYTFNLMVRHKGTDAVRVRLLEVCKSEIYSYCAKNICVEATPRVAKDVIDRIKLYQHHDYSPKLKINGAPLGKWYKNGPMNGIEYREEPLTLLECLDPKICEIEHMGSLSKNKNADVLENQEFADPGYNRWKTNKV